MEKVKTKKKKIDLYNFVKYQGFDISAWTS